jgi:hypothetical protein
MSSTVESNHESEIRGGRFPSEPENEVTKPQVISVEDRSLGQRGDYPIEGNAARDADSATGLMNTVAHQGNVVGQCPSFFVGMTDIHFENEDAWTLSNKIKGLIEDFIEAPLIWWPLSPRRKPLQDGFSRVSWKCVSGIFPEMANTSLISA